MRSLLLAAMVPCLSCALAVSPAGAQTPKDDLSTASLENLTQLQVSVSSFARKNEDLWKTPAAVFVISREDIERSAATSVPELLRMVPGMQVAQVSASTWAVSVRGFNNENANKLLVLIDGRTVYSEIFSGAHWDEDDLPLEEIERIEVIRGPGAAVWGTNAVNGVVNIITRRARSTVGAKASARIGRIDEATSLQYGGSLGDRVQYRGYGSYINRESLDKASGGRAFDGEHTLRAGGRLDWQQGAGDWLTLSGDLYGGHLKQLVTTVLSVPLGPGGRDSGSFSGGHLLSRWEHKAERSDTALQVYLDDTSRHELGTDATTHTFAADFQNHLAMGSKNDLVWGSELRLTGDHVAVHVPLTTKPDYTNYLVDSFAQDEITLIPNRVVVTLGSKIQQGTLAGFQVQPSARLLWSPSRTQSFWVATSRAVAAPTIQDRALLVPLNLGEYPTPEGLLPLTAILNGNPLYKPETVIAYEAGYRRRFGNKLTLDLASFFNVNHRVEAFLVVGPNFVPTPAPHLFLDLQLTNGYRAKTAGTEVAASWKPLSSLSLQGSYSWAQAHLTQSQAGTLSLFDSWNTPRNTFTAATSWRFAPNWSFNSFSYHIDSFAAPTGLVPTGDPTVRGFTRLDLHVARKVGRSLEFDAGGSNLLTPRHSEFGGGGGGSLILPDHIPRSIFVRATWTLR